MNQLILILLWNIRLIVIQLSYIVLTSLHQMCVKERPTCYRRFMCSIAVHPVWRGQAILKDWCRLDARQLKTRGAQEKGFTWVVS